MTVKTIKFAVLLYNQINYSGANLKFSPAKNHYLYTLLLVENFKGIQKDILYLYRLDIEKERIKFPFKRKACQVYEGGCCRQVSKVVSLVVL